MAASKAIVDTDAPLEVRKRIIEHFRHEVDFDRDIKEEWWRLLNDGYTLGIFQIEQGVKVIELAREIAPRSIEDLALLVALNKPGPMRSGDTNRYVARRQGRDSVEYVHPILEDILGITYGVFVYQEQVIAYFQAIGYDLSEADHIRKLVGKKLVKEMAAEFPRYMERAQKFMSPAQARTIWELIENFSKYGFNKAHAVAYATISAWTIYCKGRWPVEFYMASIEKNPKKVGLYVAEARRREINVLPPNVNDSGVLIAQSSKGIVYGLSDIKGVKSAAVKIVENQPYESPEDFVSRSDVNAGVKKLIIRVGALDIFGYRLEPHAACEGKGRVPEMVPKKNGDGLKRILVPCSCHEGWAQTDIPPQAAIIEAEEELLEIVLTDVTSGVVERYGEEIATLDSLDMLDDRPDGVVVTVPAVVTEVTPGKIKRGKNVGLAYANLTLEWKGVSKRAVAWPETYSDYDFAMKPWRVGAFTLRGSTGKEGQYNIVIKKAKIYV